MILHRTLLPLLCLLFAWSLPGTVMAIEEAEYRVVEKDGAIEIRDYAPSIVAEVTVEGKFEKAGNAAFRPLFRYIDGNNQARQEIAMTAPVGQTRESQKIAMTAPVSQSENERGWTVSFMMPSDFTMDTLPVPDDPRVELREVPAFRAAVIRYSGTWSEKRYQAHLDELADWLKNRGVQPAGEPVWARYNAPFTPWFMRRNEILIPISRSSVDG